MKTSLWWIRRDVRLADNQALDAACLHAEAVVPVFVVDDRLLASPGVSPRRARFLWANLRELDAQLRRRGSYLVVRRGDPAQELWRLAQQSGADAVFAEEDFSPYARRRDAAVATMFPFQLCAGMVTHAPGSVAKADGTPYTVFTPFSRAWKALPRPDRHALLPAPPRLNTPPGLATLSLPDDGLPADEPDFPPGEDEARRRLADFASSVDAEPPIFSYAQDRDRLDHSGTSMLSPYLRLGVVSARHACIAATEARAGAPQPTAAIGADTWLNELIWREFYVHLLAHFPHVRREPFRSSRRDLHWRDDPADFEAWTAGRTGYPVVDAAMRQLAMTGWMHNRARMIVASFLVKDLLVDWRRGEEWFNQQLLDGDPAANNGGWQWCAGTGADAAPFFRIFNPVLQAAKFDPHGHYVRRYLPELAGVPDRLVHEPWRLTPAEQQNAGCVIGHDYPHRIVAHEVARRRALEVYAESREA